VRAAAARESDRAARQTPRAPMLGAFAALVLVALDVAAVPAVLPSARVELGSSTSGLVWVQDAYLLTLAVALLALSRVDVDRRALAAAGLAAFAGGALLASTADSTATLVTGRTLQGAGGAALLVPALESLRPAAGETGRLLALLALAALLGFAAAPLAGGAVAEESSWRWLFRIELVAAVPALLLIAGGRAAGAQPLYDERGGAAADRAHVGGPSAADTRPLRAERTGALAAGLVLAVTGLLQSGPWGWASADTLLLLAAGAVLLGFAWRDGLTPPEAAGFVVAGALVSALLLAPQYLELVRGLSPLRSGVLTLALTLPAVTLAALAHMLAGRVPPKLPAVGGLACAALGAIGMTRIDPGSSYALVVVSLGLLGSGIGAAAGGLAGRSADAGLVAAGRSADAGLVAAGRPAEPGLVAAGRRAEPGLVEVAAPGAALVLAAVGALLQRAQLDERESGGSFEDALAAGLAASGWLLAALLAAAGLLAWRAGAAEGAGGRGRSKTSVASSTD
jgi:MFS family permease